MPIESETSTILRLYKQLGTLLDSLKDEGESSEAASSSGGMEMEIRTLAAELTELLCLDEAEYGPETQARIRVVEREIRALIGRVRNIKSKSSPLSW